MQRKMLAGASNQALRGSPAVCAEKSREFLENQLG